MRYYFIINPCAGKGGAEAKLRAAVATLPEREQCEFYITASPGDATTYVRSVCQARAGEELRFIACGGDGTINEVFSGAVGMPGVSLSCYPCGSGNDFVKCFGGAARFMDVGALLRAGEQPLDVLKVGERYSFNVANFGFDTTVAEEINRERERTGHGNKRAYARGIVKALFSSMDNACTVTADGEVLNEDGRFLLCTLANGQYVGGSFRCAPRASISDGLMEVCLVRPISRLRFVRLISSYIKGEHLDREDLRDVMIYRQAQRVQVDAPEGFAYTLDGENVHESHFTVEVVKGALSLAVPGTQALPARSDALLAAAEKA